MSQCRDIKAAEHNALVCPDEPYVASLAESRARSWIQRCLDTLHRAAKRIKLRGEETGWLSFADIKPLDARQSTATNPIEGWPSQRVRLTIDLLTCPYEAWTSEAVSLSLETANLDKSDGAETLQVYAKDPAVQETMPVRQLRAVEEVTLAAREARKVQVELNARAFA